MNESVLSEEIDCFDNMDKSEMKTLRNDLQSQIEVCEQQFKDQVEDRRNQIDIVKTLRIAMKEVESMDEGRKSLLSEFHKFRKQAEAAKIIRDEVNKMVPPPSDILEKWIMKSYISLTTIDNDLTGVPTLPREIDLFRRFFELQACIIKKKESENAHIAYVKNIESLREISKKLDSHQEEKEKSISEMTEDKEIVGNTVSRKEIRKISKKITSIDRNLDLLKIERTELRNKLNKIKSMIKERGSKIKLISITEVEQKIEEGGTLDASEFEMLLKKGDLSAIGLNRKNKIPSTDKKHMNKKKKRKFGSIQRKSRQGNTAALREND